MKNKPSKIHSCSSGLEWSPIETFSSHSSVSFLWSHWSWLQRWSTTLTTMDMAPLLLSTVDPQSETWATQQHNAQISPLRWDLLLCSAPTAQSERSSAMVLTHRSRMKSPTRLSARSKTVTETAHNRFVPALFLKSLPCALDKRLVTFQSTAQTCTTLAARMTRAAVLTALRSSCSTLASNPKNPWARNTKKLQSSHH